VRYRRLFVACGLDGALFEAVTAQLRAKAIRVKTGTPVDATAVDRASEADDESRWVKHESLLADHGFDAHVGADATTARWKRSPSRPPRSTTAALGPRLCSTIRSRSLPTARTAAPGSATPFAPRAARRASSPLEWRIETRLRHSPPGGVERAIHRVWGRIKEILGIWKRCYGLCQIRWRVLTLLAVQS
jgi:transposase, IS5 family